MFTPPQDFTHGAFAERSVILGEGENRFDDKDDRVLKLRGLPYRAAKADIIRFFEPSFNLIADQIQIVAGRDGRPAGECMVQMQSRTNRETFFGGGCRETVGQWIIYDIASFVLFFQNKLRKPPSVRTISV